MIRDLKKNDLKSIIHTYALTYSEVANDPNFGDTIRKKKPSLSYFKKWALNFYKEVKKKEAICVVSEIGSKVAGFCFVRRRDNPESELSHVGILQLRVAKEWRGKGIGTALIKEAIIRSKGTFEILDLYILRSNKVARHIYQKVGFRTWGVAPRYIKRGKRYIDLEYMYLKL